MPLSKIFLLLGSCNLALSVILGAFGAHGLKKTLSQEMMAVYHTGVQYHFIHALGLLILGVLSFQVLAFYPDFSGLKFLKGSGWLMMAGIGLFSGSLYALSLTGIKVLGAITPFGGMAFILAWLLFARAVFMFPNA